MSEMDASNGIQQFCARQIPPVTSLLNLLTDRMDVSVIKQRQHRHVAILLQPEAIFDSKFITKTFGDLALPGSAWGAQGYRPLQRSLRPLARFKGADQHQEREVRGSGDHPPPYHQFLVRHWRQYFDVAMQALFLLCSFVMQVLYPAVTEYSKCSCTDQHSFLMT